jgi:hypothetical protein
MHIFIACVCSDKRSDETSGGEAREAHGWGLLTIFLNKQCCEKIKQKLRLLKWVEMYS